MGEQEERMPRSLASWRVLRTPGSGRIEAKAEGNWIRQRLQSSTKH